jgi:integrase
MSKRIRGYLTARAVGSAKPEDKPYDLWDKKVRGLRLRVRPSGFRSWDVTYRVGGNQTSSSLGSAEIKTLAQARNEAAEVLRDAAKGIDANQIKQGLKASTLGAYIGDHYTEYAQSHMKGHKKTLSTIKRNFSKLYKKPISDISEMDITRWRKRRQKDGVTFETLQRDFTTLKAAMNTAVRKHKLVPSHQLERYTLERRADGTEPSNIKEVRYLQPDEEVRLRAALDAREDRMRQVRKEANEDRISRGRAGLPPFPTPYVDYLKPLVLLGMNTGLRRGDLFDLEWTHVDLSHRQIRKVIAKTSRSKATEPAVLPLTDEAVKTLKSWKGQGTGVGLLFPSPRTGGRLDNINKAWGNLLSDAEIDNFRFHDLRHTFASKLVMAGVDLNTVRVLMTHADIKMTLVYAHLSPDHKAAALEKAFGAQR